MELDACSMPVDVMCIQVVFRFHVLNTDDSMPMMMQKKTWVSSVKFAVSSMSVEVTSIEVVLMSWLQNSMTLERRGKKGIFRISDDWKAEIKTLVVYKPQKTRMKHTRNFPF